VIGSLPPNDRRKLCPGSEVDGEKMDEMVPSEIVIAVLSSHAI
jgi:hypothetical protein